MRKGAFGLIAALAALTVFAFDGSEAWAQPADKAAEKVDPALKALLLPRDGNEICFTRAYDAAHLRRHPRQKVRYLSLLIAVEHIKEDNLYRYNFTMRARIKGVRKMLKTGGECGYAYATEPKPGPAHLIGCGVECDGGGVLIEQEPGTQNLLMHLAEKAESPGKPREAGRIRMAACGESEEENPIDLVSGADDKTFRLMKAPATACRSGGR